MRGAPLVWLVGALLSPAPSSASPPLEPAKGPPPRPAWREARLDLDWPLSGDPGWECPGGEGRLRVDRLRVLREVSLSPPRVVSRSLRLAHADQVVVVLSFLNPGAEDCRAPRPSLFTERGLATDDALTGTSTLLLSVEPHGTGGVRVDGSVPIGTRAIWLTTPRAAGRVKLDLESGVASLVSPGGEVLATSGSRPRAMEPASEPRYEKIPVDQRFPGVSMVQGGRDCSRFFDLGIDDVYFVRGVDDGYSVHDELVLDATFYQAAAGAGDRDCSRHVATTRDYVLRLLKGGFSVPGREAGSRIVTLGARQLRRFEVEPGAREVTLGFGDPLEQPDVLLVDLERRAARVVKRSPALELTATRDLREDWARRKVDPGAYLSLKFVRGYAMRTDPEAWERAPAQACERLAGLLGGTYRPGGEAEPLWETSKLACPPQGVSAPTP